MIKQAIIPLAGLGTRLLPLSSVIPKELLPLHGKPNLEYILEECVEAGIKEFIFVISDKKKNIKKYFFNDSFFILDRLFSIYFWKKIHFFAKKMRNYFLSSKIK